MWDTSGRRVFLSLVLVCLATLGLRATPPPGAEQVPARAPVSAARPDLSSPRQIPLHFVENGGQFPAGVGFEARTAARRVALSRDGIICEFGEAGGKTASFRAIYEGANAKVIFQAKDSLAGRINYFLGSDPGRWVSGTRAFGRIVYRELYPRVDLHVFGDGESLKCEYHIGRGGDASAIRWRYREGRANVNERGRLEVRGSLGVLTEDLPRSYQLVKGIAVPVVTGYAVSPAGDVGFCVGPYDHARELVIDPDVLYSSFLGGGSADAAYAIAVDANGESYIAGSTTSTNFPTVSGAYDTSPNGLTDVFVTKFNAAGTGLIYSTYIGGSAVESALGIAVDAGGNAIITGQTESSNFPTTAGAFDRSQNGNFDAFAVKLNAAGGSLVYSTFLGGSGFDSGSAVVLDASGNAYIAGATASSDYPTTSGAYDRTYNGSPYQDVFLSKLNAAGSALVYSTFLGGTQDDVGRAVAVGGEGDAYVTGYTDSVNFPTTAGAYDRTKGLYQDVFVAKFNASGTALVYSTFIGGSLDDSGNAIGVDSSGNAYVGGTTHSSNYPTTAGAYDTSFNGQGDAFVSKLNAAGSALAYSTFLGGSAEDAIVGLAVSDSGVVCATGQTASSDFPTTPDAFGPSLQGSVDAFITKLNAAGNLVPYSTFLGGTASDYGTAAAADRAGNVYVSGYTDSSDFPTSLGAYDRSYNRTQDAFLFALSAGLTSLPLPKHALGDFDGDGRNEIAVDFGPAGISVWDAGAWTLISASDPEGLVAGNFAGLTGDQLAADFGAAGVSIWNGATWNVISAQNAQRMVVADTDGNGRQELLVDFGALGLWLWKGGPWTQLSGANADFILAADLDGSGDDEIVGDFGALGLWQWNSGAWSQLSGADADFVIAADVDGDGAKEVIGDFGALGLWIKNSTGWTEVSSADADFMVAADLNGNGTAEVLASFGALGTWQGTIYVWTKLSSADGSDMAAANTDGNSDQEVAVDFGALGLWLRNGSQWSQLSGRNPESITAGDLDADGADELVVDFGSIGLWLWNAGVWTRISALNAD